MFGWKGGVDAGFRKHPLENETSGASPQIAGVGADLQPRLRTVLDRAEHIPGLRVQV